MKDLDKDLMTVYESTSQSMKGMSLPPIPSRTYPYKTHNVYCKVPSDRNNTGNIPEISLTVIANMNLIALEIAFSEESISNVFQLPGYFGVQAGKKGVAVLNTEHYKFNQLTKGCEICESPEHKTELCPKFNGIIPANRSMIKHSKKTLYPVWTSIQAGYQELIGKKNSFLTKIKEAIDYSYAYRKYATYVPSEAISKIVENIKGENQEGYMFVPNPKLTDEEAEKLVSSGSFATAMAERAFNKERESTKLTLPTKEFRDLSKKAWVKELTKEQLARNSSSQSPTRGTPSSNTKKYLQIPTGIHDLIQEREQALEVSKEWAKKCTSKKMSKILSQEDVNEYKFRLIWQQDKWIPMEETDLDQIKVFFKIYDFVAQSGDFKPIDIKFKTSSLQSLNTIIKSQNFQEALKSFARNVIYKKDVARIQAKAVNKFVEAAVVEERKEHVKELQKFIEGQNINRDIIEAQKKHQNCSVTAAAMVVAKLGLHTEILDYYYNRNDSNFETRLPEDHSSHDMENALIKKRIHHTLTVIYMHCVKSWIRDQPETITTDEDYGLILRFLDRVFLVENKVSDTKDFGDIIYNLDLHSWKVHWKTVLEIEDATNAILQKAGREKTNSITERFEDQVSTILEFLTEDIIRFADKMVATVIASKSTSRPISLPDLVFSKLETNQWACDFILLSTLGMETDQSICTKAELQKIQANAYLMKFLDHPDTDKKIADIFADAISVRQKGKQENSRRSSYSSQARHSHDDISRLDSPPKSLDGRDSNSQY